MGYTHRERVLATFGHDEADRIPIDMMGNATMLLDDSYMRLRDYLDLDPIPPVRSGTSANYYDTRILERFDVDFRRVFLMKNPNARSEVRDDGTIVDAWGVGYSKAGLYVNTTIHPLTGVEDETMVHDYQWPSADEMYSADGLAEEARRLSGETDYALVARNPLTYGFLDRACQLMRMDEFLMNMAAEPKLAHAIIDHLLTAYKDVFVLFLEAVGPYVNMVEIGDDIGSTKSLIVSPDMYREFIKPAERELYGLIHELAPNAALFRHTDGAIFDIIPDLIEVGVDVLNPVQTSTAGMEARGLKRAYGDQITFHGAVEGLESATDEDDAIAEIRDRIDALAPGGGYVLASCNHIMDVSPEIIVAAYDEAREYGTYSKGSPVAG
jgi:uroporphyrinogen decarboxylase